MGKVTFTPDWANDRTFELDSDTSSKDCKFTLSHTSGDRAVFAYVDRGCAERLIEALQNYLNTGDPQTKRSTKPRRGDTVRITRYSAATQWSKDEGPGQSPLIGAVGIVGAVHDSGQAYPYEVNDLITRHGSTEQHVLCLEDELEVVLRNTKPEPVPASSEPTIEISKVRELLGELSDSLEG